MLRLSRQADYGIVIMTHMARQDERRHNAPEIAALTRVPQPMASKILKTLARAGLLVSHRGAKGGYGFARSPERVTVAEVIQALDGPIALTACLDDARGDCEIELLCPARANWERINRAIRDALDGITLQEMARTLPFAFDPLAAGRRDDHGARADAARAGRA